MTTHDDATRVIAELTVRIQALETWRTHHADLVEELINGLSAGPSDSDPEDDIDVDIDGLVLWVHSMITSMIARPLRGELVWCPRWWDHPEAVFRLEALRRAWIELAPEPGAAVSLWIRDHLDPCLRELLSPLGPFADCTASDRARSHAAHTPLPPLPIHHPDETG